MARRREQPKGRGTGKGGVGRGFYVALAVLVVAGVVGLALAGRSDSGSVTRPLSVAELSAGADPDAGVALGPESAPVTILEFTDLQCPVCKQFNALTGRLLRQNFAGPDGPVRWVSHDFPLDQHRNAVPSALAARCAEAQGRYWEMHDLLLGRQDEWAEESSPSRRFSGYAKDLGLDTGEFDRCLQERHHISQVIASKRYGEQLGVSGTPTVFLNGELLRERSYREIEERIRRAAAGREG